MKESAEERGRLFLKFIGENEQRLRRNLAKNVEYERDLFEDVFSYTVIRVYDSIRAGRAKVKDFEQYFYIASRHNYHKKRERERKRQNRLHSLVGINDRREEEAPEAPQYPELTSLRSAVIKEFGPVKTKLFFDFMKAKVRYGMTYSSYAIKHSIPTSRVSKVCISIKKYLRERYHGMDPEEE